jgi:hypothetical protein
MVRYAAVCSRSSHLRGFWFRKTLAFTCIFLTMLVAPAFAQKSAGAGSANVRAMQLVTPAAGWALTDQHLMWTSDAGQDWKDITPAGPLPQSLDGVFFLDENAGWVVLSGADSTSLGSSLQLAVTNDGGAAWQFHPLTVVEAQVLDSYTGIVSLNFVDNAHGWMMIRLASSSNFSLGMLFATADGGATWAQLPSPPIGNRIRFTTVQDGWLAGGAGGDEIYATHDGGYTWQAPLIPRLSGVGSDLRPQYELPVFASSVDGTLAVSFVGAQTTSFAAYSTHDGGYSWTVIEARAGLPAGQKLATSVFDSTVVKATVAPGRVTLALGPTQRSAPVSAANPAIQQLDFKNDSQGWMLVSSSQCAGFKTDCVDTTQLLATTDGGATLTDITPNVVETSGGIQALAAAGIIRQSTGQTEGFDACTPTTVAQMQDWWLNSPYKSVNIYLGGASLSSCAKPLHDANWVTQSAGMGWGIIPTWVGPQAPLTGSTTAYKCSTCTTCTHTISTDPTVAATQGTAEADSAMAATANVGLDKTIIYYDMEKYNQNANVPTCRAAVQAFLNAWTQELHAKGYLAGIYTSDANFRDDLTVDNPGVGPANVADAIWIARWNLRDTIYGYMYLADTYWTNHQRIHQWNTGTKKYGNTTLSIDFDAVDGILALPGTLILTATISQAGAGMVTSDPAGVNCTSTCQVGMPTNGAVTLAATPIGTAQSTFTGWTGCDSTMGNTCTVTMNVARNVAANFTTPAATMISPAPYSALSSQSVTFNWNPGVAATQYMLTVGNAPGQTTYSGATLDAATTSLTVNGLPADGSAVYVRLSSNINGSWQYLDYTYTAVTATTTTVVSGTNPSLVGQQVTFTATVAPAFGTVTPTGSVSFLDGATVLGTANLSAGVATYKTTATALTQGPHSIIASYAGGSAFLASASTPLSQLVNLSTTTSVSAAPNTYGDLAAVTVTVSATGNTPSGDVTLSVDGIVQGTQTLNNGAVIFSVAAGFAAGPHALQAAFAAQNAFGASSGAGTLTVSTRPVTVTADTLSKVYGQTDPTLTYKVTSGSLALSDAFSGVLARDPGENVGSYPINQGTLVLSSNYQLTYVPAVLTITPAALIITADNNTMILGGAMPALTVSYSGFANGDTSASLTTKPTLTTVPANSAIGSYEITVGGAVDPNYVITYKPGTLNITYNVCYLYDQTKAVQFTATVPIRVQLCNASGINASSPAIVLHAYQVALTGGTTGPVGDSGNANPDDNFRYDGYGYIFNLSTKPLSSGTWVLSFTATGDPVAHSAGFGVR